MTALNFPSSPTYGQTYSFYTWDGEKWYLTVGGTGAANPIWTPSQLTGLVGWYDASVYASMTIASTEITAMADQSGLGNTLTRLGITHSGPAYSATGFNTSYPAMVYSSAGRLGLFNNIAPFPMGSGNTMTAWYVGRNTGGAIGASYNRPMTYTPPGGTHDYNSVSAFCLASVVFSTTDYTFIKNVGVPFSMANGDRRVIVTVDSSGTATVYVDGVVAASGSVTVGNWTTGGVFSIGYSYLDAAWWGGPIAEAGIANGFSNSTVVAQLDTYLKNKWGLNPATNFLARTSGLDATHTNAYTALIEGLVADGVWYKLDMLHIYATQDSTTAKLNLISSSYPATLTGTPVFTADRGYTGGYFYSMGTAFNPTTASLPKYVQDSAHISVWNLLNVSDSEGAMGYAAGGGETNIYPSLGGTSYYRVNSGGIAGVAAGSPTTGHYLANRSASTALQGYRNGSSVLTNSAASSPVQNLEIKVLAVSGGGGSTYQAAMSSIGASLNSTEALAFYNRLRTYMTAVGVP